MTIYYFDHAASSWPKPPEVIKAMADCVELYGANPGRGGHRMAVQASKILFAARANLAKLFNIKNANDISFALNTTAALNQAISGFVQPNDHVISTSIEHNSVRRPLEYLKRTKQVEVTFLQTNEKGELDLDDIVQAIRPNTSLLICSHGSNLLGSIMPIADIAEICRKHGVKVLVDAAQTAGTYPIDVQAMGIDMLAFPGHKGLLGPQGTGGLYLAPDLVLEPHLHGGTGSQSESIEQPTVRPDRYEAGTPNTPGIAGLNEGVKLIMQTGVANIHHKEWQLSQQLLEGLQQIPGVKCFGPELGEPRSGIVSFLIEGVEASEAAFILDQSFQIAVRAGYHCTPLGHETAGTTDSGAVRSSVGFYTSKEDVDYFLSAIREISKHYVSK
ncbi:aminotransferase class V-fold PLP-dependent enzyme [Paenibacillus senegalensis]|uniref:aminotransferase class V-fold PLP-dependent enzyme n=1 Tax=Paenibacillus senegalensis TaxID=1465766 RepID=UPI000288FF69|nr:aminotransferase class V-fold PLP-dependent enzyme [Paenibacillus senegalensis]